MSAIAIKATFSDFRLVKGRKVAQLVFEVPIEGADDALETLGGVPRMDKEAWVGIARLDTTQPKPKAISAPPQRDSEPSKERRKFAELGPSQQAGIICNEPAFWKYLKEERDWVPCGDAGNAAYFVRDFCQVKSRSELATNESAKLKWSLLASSYLAWRNVLV